MNKNKIAVIVLTWNDWKNTIQALDSILINKNNNFDIILVDNNSNFFHINKIIEWIKDLSRKVPIICTGNELPTIFKRNAEHIEIIRCFPPRAAEVQKIFKDVDVTDMIKECQHDIRKLIHRVQYGDSYVIPKYLAPPTGLPIEKMFGMRQQMFELPDCLLEYRVDIQDSEPTSKTSSKYKRGGKRVHTDVSDTRQKKSNLGKSRNLK